MSDQINLDDPLDAVSEGLQAPDDADLAQDLADRQAAASQTEPADDKDEGGEDDFLTEKFIYTKPDGSEVELTGEELLAAQEKAAALEAELEALKAKPPEKAPEKPPEKAAPESEAIAPVEWDKVGNNFVEMLDDPAKHKEIGPALNDVIHRTILSSEHIGAAMVNFVTATINGILAQREEGAKAESGLKEFVGDDIPETEVAAFMQKNPWAKNKETAIVGIKAARLETQLADFKAGKKVELDAAGKEGAKKIVKDLKAKGQLRRLGTGGSRGGASSSAAENIRKGKNLTNENDRLAAGVEVLKALRQGRGT
jgi:hypothetical protein